MLTLFTAGLVWALERPLSFVPALSKIPPLGKFLDPFHGFWQNAEAKQKAEGSRELSLSALKQQVNVLYDSLMVPHIFAQNETDLWFMQGYLTAKDRLWQMEFQALAAAGRISERIASKRTLAFDRLQRRKGIPYAAKKFVRQLENMPEAKHIMEAYAEGVNAHIATLDKYDKLPLEYKLMHYKPEKWTVYKSALILKYMANDLSFGDSDLENTNAIKHYGAAMFDLLYPDLRNRPDPIVKPDSAWGFEAEPLKAPAHALPKEAYIKQNIDEIIALSAAKIGKDSLKAEKNKTNGIEEEKKDGFLAEDTAKNNLPEGAKESLPTGIKESLPAGTKDSIIYREKMPDPNPNNGSNNWAVSGKKTKNGNPILCNDPHLQLNLPSIWYCMQLQAEEMNVKGATLPGVPQVIIGFNDSIAWGVTNARRDVVDWYEITFKDEEKRFYKLDGKWEKTQYVVEEIKIKDKKNFYDTVYYTHWGPVTYDHSFFPENNRRNFALRWLAHDASEELLAFHKLNKAKNYADFLDALKHYANPAQNFVFAAANGDIAMQVQGKFPNKWPQQGKFVLDGSRSDMAWQGFIPFNHNVRALNPERGFVSSANQHPADSTYPYYVYDDSYEGYRNRRINQLLREANFITVEQMKAMQNDNFNLMAAESLSELLKFIDRNTLNEAEQKMYESLTSWHFYNNPEKIAPVYFEAFCDALFPLIWDEMRKSPFPLPRPSKINTLELIKKYPKLHFFDILETPEQEDAAAVVRKAFREGAEQIRAWEAAYSQPLDWGNFKSTTALHLSRLPALSAQNIYTGGNHGIVNATGTRHGASWRMIVELNRRKPVAWGVYPGGQSGNPGSFYYDNMIDYWKNGKYLPMSLIYPEDSKENLLHIRYTE